MAGKEKFLVGRLDQLSIRLPTPPLTTSNETSPDSPTPSREFSRETLPSGVDTILAELRNRRSGRSQQDSEWWCIQRSLDEFESLEAQIQTDEDLAGVKYDYFPRLSKFVLRMADDLHEVVIGQLETEIIEQLFFIKRGDNQRAADFARKIIATRSPKIFLKERARHVPDGSFSHEDVSYPGVIIEVSHSQKRKDLPFVADDYILGSDGIIQVVIGIDLEYEKRKGKEAKVFVWRPRFVEREGVIELEESQTFESIFRAEDGSLVNENLVLSIQLKDFGNKFACPGIDNISGEITIPFSQLYDIVQRGEKRKQTVRRKREMNEVDIDMRKRARVRSPPE